MHDMHDSWFFVGIFVFIFLVWIATGGPVHPLAFSGPRLSQPQELGGGTYLSLPRAPFSVGGSRSSLAGGDTPSDSDTSTGLQGSGTAFGEASPYRGIVILSHYVSGAGSTDPKDESIELRVSSSATVPVDISGWTLSSDAGGGSITIPRGTEVPTSGTVNAVQDIVLTAGTHATIISGQSPIGGSFRENKCIGYFGSFQTFSPPLPQDCPISSDELVAFYGSNYIRDAACIDYVKKLSRCRVVLSPPNNLSGVCQSFLVKYLNYNGCVDAHQRDADFAGDTWRIYLGRTTSMWRPRHEIVRLTDAQGKTVDVFSY
jgi:hypothetical protein